MTLWIKEQNSALPRDGAARAASPPACAACTLPPFRNLSRPNQLSTKAGLACENQRTVSSGHAPARISGFLLGRFRRAISETGANPDPLKSGFPLIWRRWFAIEARANTRFFLQYYPLSARPRPAGEALPDARIRLSVGYTLPSLKSPAAWAFSMLEKLLQKPQQTCGWGIFSPLSCAPKRIRECHNPPRFFQRWPSVFRLVFRHFRQPPASHACAAVSPRFSPLRHMRRGLFFLSLLARP